MLSLNINIWLHVYKWSENVWKKPNNVKKTKKGLKKIKKRET